MNIISNKMVFQPCSIVIVSVLVLYSSSQVQGSCPTIKTRSQWGAQAAVSRQSLSVNPPTFAIIHHSDGSSCLTETSCKARVAGIQADHINNRHWKDIGYNFLIGGDGNVYEGRGWGTWGAHCPNYNSKSIGICMIGNFQSEKPSDKQLTALRNLLECGVSGGNLASSYKLIGHRQGKRTDCPGNALFNEIKNWEHFDSSVSP